MPDAIAPDAAVLARLMMLQSALDVGPSHAWLAEAVERTLEGVPGVAASALSLDGVVLAANGARAEWLGAARGTAGFQGEQAGETPGQGVFNFAVSTSRSCHGELRVLASDRAAFEPYAPFIGNLANLIAIHVENKQVIDDLGVLNANLELLAQDRAVALARNAHDMAFMFDHAPIGMILVDEALRVKRANKAALAIFKKGQNVEDASLFALLGCSNERTPAIGGARGERECGCRDLEQAIRDLFAKAAPCDRETFFLDVNRAGVAESIVMEASLVLLEGPVDGQALMMIEEVTEKRRAERILREAQARLNLAIKASNVGLWEWNLVNHEVYFSPEWKRQLGHEDHEFPDRFEEWKSRLHPDDRERTRAYLSNSLKRSDGFYRLEYRMRHKDGSYRWILAQASVVLDSNGQPERMVGCHIDITEKKEADEARHASEELLRAFIHSSPDFIYMKDRELRYTLINPALERGLGLSAKGIIGKTCHDLFPVEVAGPIEEEDRKALSGAVVRLRVERVINGHPFLLETTKAPVYAADGKVIGVCCIARDIGEQARLQQDKERLEEQIRQAQKMEAVGQLAGGVAHDFNNLLQAINGYADVALEEIAPDDRARDYLLEIAKAGNRAAELVSQLLAFSRRKVMKIVSLDPNEVIGDIFKILRRVIGEHIRLTFVPFPSHGSIDADHGMLEQVIMNLCINARDAMPQGGGLTIKTRIVPTDAEFLGPRAPDSDEYFMIQVSDTGVGMDEATVQRVFEPFFTTKAPDHGTGLGMATVYGIVEQHHGVIRVASKLNRGTDIRVYFPYHDDTASRDGERRNRVKDKPVGGNEAILVAEDDALVRKLARHMLESAGYRVLEAKDGKEALRLIEERRGEIDLALLDVLMPKMSGRDVYEAMKRMKARVPVLFASGYDDSTLQSDFLADEGLTLIQKPYRSDILLRHVREVLDAKRPK